MVEFKIDFLVDRSDEGVIAEVQRVAELVAPAVLTQSLFDKHAKISASAVRHRFGGWQSALNLAGLAERYSGQTVIWKRRRHLSRGNTGGAASAALIMRPTVRSAKGWPTEVFSLRGAGTTRRTINYWP